MGNRYSHVTIEERCEIARLQAKGRSIRQIAASLDRPPSTISRELKRNATQSSGYKPRYADEQAQARRWSGSRLDRDDRLRDQVLSGLRAGWSPEQVAGRLALQSGRKVISHETIYRFIYAQLVSTYRLSNPGAGALSRQATEGKEYRLEDRITSLVQEFMQRCAPH